MLHVLKAQWRSFVDEHFSNCSEHDILTRQVNANDECPFSKSGFMPYKIVAYHCWIRK